MCKVWIDGRGNFRTAASFEVTTLGLSSLCLKFINTASQQPQAQQPAHLPTSERHSHFDSCLIKSSFPSPISNPDPPAPK